MEAALDNFVAHPKSEDGAPPRPRISARTVLNKSRFFLTGASVTCIASTGRLTSKAFETGLFISDCFSVFFYVNIAAFLAVLLLVECDSRKAIVSGWSCLLVHLLYIIIAAFGRGGAARALYISLYACIATLEAFVIQSNSFVVASQYSSSYFSSLYAGYYGGVAIFSLIQLLFQHLLGTETREQARLCLVCTHGAFSLVVLAAVVAQTVAYFRAPHPPKRAQPGSLRASCTKKIVCMYRVLRSLPRYSPGFAVFALADLCKCAFFQVFIPYRMLLNDSQLVVVFFVDNFADILARSVAGYADDTIAPGSSLSPPRRVLRRNAPFLATLCLCWALCSLVVWATWTLRAPPLARFPAILALTLFVALSVGYCSTRGINGCIPILDFYSRQTDCEGGALFPPLDKETRSYVNDLNTFLIKLLWLVVFLCVYFLSGVMERHQASARYQELRRLLKLY